MGGGKVGNSYSRPLIDPQTHPIAVGDYFIATNAISRLYEYVNIWIRNRIPGAIIYGYPRIGKTDAIRYLVTTLQEDLGSEFPIYHITCKSRKNPNESLFFEDLLVGVKHDLALVGSKANVKRSRILNLLIEKAEMANSNKLIFFLDEAQNLFEMEYKWLMDLYNELSLSKIHLIVFLVGQKELLNQRTAYRDVGKYQLVGRFMSQAYEFKGIQDLDDLEEFLLGYDEFSEYPPNSKFSYTRYYFPIAFENGFRLKILAPMILEMIQEARRKNGINKDLDIPMQYIVLFIENIFLEYGNHLEEEYDIQHIPQNLLEKIFNNTGYLEWEIYGRI